MSTRWKSFAQTSWGASQSPSSTSPSAAQTSPTPQFYHLAHRQLHLSLVSILEFVQSFTTLPLTSPICHYSVFWHTPSFLPLHLTSSICHFFQQGFSASLGFLISFIERKSQVYEIRLPWNWTCNWILQSPLLECLCCPFIWLSRLKSTPPFFGVLYARDKNAVTTDTFTSSIYNFSTFRVVLATPSIALRHDPSELTQSWLASTPPRYSL